MNTFAVKYSCVSYIVTFYYICDIYLLLKNYRSCFSYVFFIVFVNILCKSILSFPHPRKRKLDISLGRCDPDAFNILLLIE